MPSLYDDPILVDGKEMVAAAKCVLELQRCDKAGNKISVLLKALNDIAAWEEGEKVGADFDEPHAALRAREALAVWKSEMQREDYVQPSEPWPRK